VTHKKTFETLAGKSSRKKMTWQVFFSDGRKVIQTHLFSETYHFKTNRRGKLRKCWAFQIRLINTREKSGRIVFFSERQESHPNLTSNPTEERNFKNYKALKSAPLQTPANRLFSHLEINLDAANVAARETTTEGRPFPTRQCSESTGCSSCL